MKRLLSLLILINSCACGAVEAPSAEQFKFFESKVRPLLVNNCMKCHGPKTQKSGLRVDTLDALLKGGETAAALVRGDPEKSLLIKAITYKDEDLQMPPVEKLTKEGGKLADADIQTLTEWVKMGAPWPEGRSLAGEHKTRTITAEDKQFWSFQPVKDVTPPPADPHGWCKNEIDRFILAKLDAEQLTPAEPADRRSLIRRVTFDLHGLPATPQEISEFVNDQSADAYPKLIDRLLASPRYGERWARHWLDLVRYAESDGFKQDGFRPNAWPYRDYVVRAFNSDKPYDRFVQEQLAGDELAPNDPDVLAAAEYLRLSMYEYNQRDVPKQWSEYLNDITDVTGDVFMGMSMGCARCHDHKFDPILQADYFRLQAFFSALLPRQDLSLATPEQKAQHDAAEKKWEEKTAAIRAQMAEIEKPLLERGRKSAIEKFLPEIASMMTKPKPERDPYEEQIAELAFRQVRFEEEQVEGKLKGADRDKWTALKRKLAEFDDLKPKPLQPAFVSTDVGPTGPPAKIPGDREKREFMPGCLTVLGAETPPITPLANSTGRRTALAQWLTRPENPLTARVIVNRIWQNHFGRGLVATSSDYGKLGERPSHPELLDWLARNFVQNGWSFKKMHRLILLSATYQQSALRPAPETAKLKDPENRWLWKMNERRLQAEQVRDAMLLASGELQESAGGPSATDANSTRRSIYTRVLRNTPDPLIAAFDGADGINSICNRNCTVTAPQALLLINGPWVLKRANAFAARLEKLKLSPEETVATAYRWAFNREARPDEVARGVAFIKREAGSSSSSATAVAQKPLTATMPLRGTQALAIHKGASSEILKLDDISKLPTGDFTIESYVLLESIFDNANVRTIAAQWDGDQKHAGWSLGVTSEKSKYQPRNVILQFVGKEGYEVIASDLRLELHRPYYVAAAIKWADTTPAGVTFWVKDLSDPDTPLHVANVAHKNSEPVQAKVPLTLGGRAGHGWDGLLDEVRITEGVVVKEKLMVNDDPGSKAIACWRFEEQPGVFSDTCGRQPDLTPLVPGANRAEHSASTALEDFCHVLFNASEFMFVD